MGKANGQKRPGKHAAAKVETSNKRNVRKKQTGLKSSRESRSIRDESSKRAPTAPNTAPMPAVKSGFVVKCKNDDPTNRYQLVVKGQLANRVYVVLNTKFDKEFCMKIEPFSAGNELKQLKRDLFVLCDARKYPSTLGSHFLAITNKGCVDDYFNYIVMPLGEGNILDIRKNVVGGDFSLETAVRLSLETFQAINDLHSLSYIHRSIGPTKFIVGPEGSRLYMVGLSLTMCMYKPSKSNPKHIHKYGSNRFQSCNWHKRREQFYRDDLESWAYMAIDMFSQKHLPWTVGMLDLKMLELKEQFMRGDLESITGSLPQLMKNCMLKISELRETEKPDYRQFKETLLLLRKEVHCEMKGPYNWGSGKEKIKESKREKVASKDEQSPFVNDDVGEKDKEKETESKDSKKSNKKSKSSNKKKDGTKKLPPKGMNVQMILEQMPHGTVEDMSGHKASPKESPKRTDSMKLKKKAKEEGEKEDEEHEEKKAASADEKKKDKKFDEEEYETEENDEVKKKSNEPLANSVPVPASTPPPKVLKQSEYLGK